MLKLYRIKLALLFIIYGLSGGEQALAGGNLIKAESVSKYKLKLVANFWEPQTFSLCKIRESICRDCSIISSTLSFESL